MIHLAFADPHTMVRKSIINSLTFFKDINVIFDSDNGKELIDKIKGSVLKPDICVIEIYMPRLNGFNTVEEIKKKWPKIKVLVLTSSANEFHIAEMIRCGANGYLTKESSVDKLDLAIRSISNQGFYYSEMVSKVLHSSFTAGNQFNITEKEKTFLKYCCSDLTYSEIAEQMRTTTKSVEGYRDSLFRKINVKSRPGLVVFAFKLGILIADEITL